MKNTIETTFASDFSQIPTALATNPGLQRKVISLVDSEPILGKSIAEEERKDALREILRALVLGRENIHQAIRRVTAELPRSGSVYSIDNRVFAQGWEERLVRTQLSRFYNQAVLEILRDQGEEDCYVPVSSSQSHSTKCSREIAGKTHRVDELLENLCCAYGEGDYKQKKRIPEHPHCTHVVRPI